MSNWNKKPDDEKICRWTEFFTSWTITSEKCTRAHVQENKSIYLSIYLSVWKPFWKRVYIYITLDFNTGKFKPSSKLSTTPLYVQSQSNHPPNILRNIPVAINRRLSSVSSDHEVFNEASAPYQEALRKSGYAFKLEFKPPPQQPPSQKRKRQRNVIWFNPPYNKSVKTNIGRAFISLIERSFPAGHKLRKIFNRNIIKLSYSCMPK